MQGQDFIFFLQAKDRSFWQLDGSGMVTKNNNPYPLVFSPDGWNDLAIQNIRNKKYWGIDRTVSVPLSYVEDGATILKSIFLKYGIEETVYLVIAMQELAYTPGVEYGYWYKQIYRGEIDLSTYNHAGAKVTCTTLEDGLPKYFKANENTTFEFPMNVPEAINVKMDGINLRNTVNYGFMNITDTYGINNFTQAVPLIYLNQEGDSVDSIFVGQNLEFANQIKTNPTEPYYTNSNNFFYRNTGANTIIINLSGTFIFSKNTADPYTIWFETKNGIKFITTATGIANSSFSIPFNFAISVLPGEKIFLFASYFGFITYSEETVIRINLITRYAPTYIKAFRPQYLFEKLVNIVTEGNYSAAISAYFEQYKNVLFTGGNSIRGLSDAVMKISFSDFFKFWDSFDSVGIVDRKTTIDFGAKVNLVDKVNYIDLVEPSNFKVTVAKDQLFNEVEIGYPEIKNDIGVINGNEEFNTKFLFSVGTTKAPAKIDKISKIKASCYEIEKIRVTTFSKDTTDFKADNDLFVLHIENSIQIGNGVTPTHYRLDRSLNTGATGLLEPDTVFNIFLSPKRMLLRNGQFLSSCMYLADLLILKYQSSDKNNKLIAGGITEKADVSIASLGDKFFYPVLFDFDVPAPNELISLLNLNPLQVFRFPFDGNYYFGILSKVSIAPSNRKEQSYQLISINQDLTKLISFYG